MSTSVKIALRWMPQNTLDDKSEFFGVTAWCLQATSNYLNQCWPRSVSLYGITRLQWVIHSFIIIMWLLTLWCFICFSYFLIAINHLWFWHIDFGEHDLWENAFKVWSCTQERSVKTTPFHLLLNHTLQGLYVSPNLWITWIHKEFIQ